MDFWSTNQLCSYPNSVVNYPELCGGPTSKSQGKPAWLGCTAGVTGNSCYTKPYTKGNCCGCPVWSGKYETYPHGTTSPGTIGNLPGDIKYLTGIFKEKAVTTLYPNGQNDYCKAYSKYWINNVLLPDLVWMKKGCTSTYTFAFDDPTSTFTCSSASGGKGDTVNKQNYTITFCPGGNGAGTVNGNAVNPDP